jgi:hypothetical protein
MKIDIGELIITFLSVLFLFSILHLFGIHFKVDWLEKKQEEPVFLKSDLFLVKGVDNHLSVPIYYIKSQRNELSFKLLSTQNWTKGDTLVFTKLITE